MHELRVFQQNAKDRGDLRAALMVFARNTSHLLRTQANQIQYKFSNPNNPHGDFYFVGLYQDGEVVGFVMFGFYPRYRVVVVDHMAIDKAYRKHGSFYVYASLLQQCIEEKCPGYDFVVAEIAADQEFAEDEVSGLALIRLLRQVGFGRVQIKYKLANTEPKDYKRTYGGALMLRGTQPTSRIRVEDLLDVYHTILFEHYLPWYKDFFGNLVPKYEAHLSALYRGLQKQLQSESSVVVNGGRHDELAVKPVKRNRDVLGLPKRAIGHFLLFLGVLFSVAGVGWFLGLGGRTLLAFSIGLIFVYVALAALSDAKALKVFDKLTPLISKLLSRK